MPKLQVCLSLTLTKSSMSGSRSWSLVDMLPDLAAPPPSIVRGLSCKPRSSSHPWTTTCSRKHEKKILFALTPQRSSFCCAAFGFLVPDWRFSPRFCPEKAFCPPCLPCRSGWESVHFEPWALIWTQMGSRTSSLWHKVDNRCQSIPGGGAPSLSTHQCNQTPLKHAPLPTSFLFLSPL